METNVFQVLECLDIESNLEISYIKELVEVLKTTLMPIYSNERHKLQPSIFSCRKSHISISATSNCNCI